MFYLCVITLKTENEKSNFILLFISIPVIVNCQTSPTFSGREVPFTLDVRDRLIRVEERITALEKRIDDLRNLIYVVLAGIFVLIGFVIWDRRTAITPVARDMRKVKEVLDELSKKIPELKEILKQVALY